MVTFLPSSKLPLGLCIHSQICALEISTVAASSIRLLIGTHPEPRSHDSRYCKLTLILFRSPASVIVPSGNFNRSAAVTCTSSRFLRAIWKDEIWNVAEFLNCTEDIIPAPAV